MLTCALIILFLFPPQALLIKHYIIVPAAHQINLSAQFQLEVDDTEGNWNCPGYSYPIAFESSGKDFLAHSIELKPNVEVQCLGLKVRLVNNVTETFTWSSEKSKTYFCSGDVSKTTFLQYSVGDASKDGNNAIFKLKPSYPFDVYNEQPDESCVTHKTIYIPDPELQLVWDRTDDDVTGYCQLVNRTVIQMQCNMSVLVPVPNAGILEPISKVTLIKSVPIPKLVEWINAPYVICKAECKLPNSPLQHVSIRHDLNSSSVEGVLNAREWSKEYIYTLATYILSGLLLLSLMLITGTICIARKYRKKLKKTSPESGSTLSHFVHHTDHDGYSRILYPPRPGSQQYSLPLPDLPRDTLSHDLPPVPQPNCDVFSAHYNRVSIKLSDSIREAEQLERNLKLSRRLSERISGSKMDAKTFSYIPEIYSEHSGASTWHGIKNNLNPTYEKLPD